MDVDNRDMFVEYMKNKGIHCSVHFYTPLHLQPAYEKYNTKELPKTVAKAKTTVSLPLYADMTKEEVDYVIKYVKEWQDGKRD
jgi:dTDP-4-amino-4,6-dideoxygalactose transaminase